MNSMNRNQQQASIGVTHLSTTTQALLPRYLIAWLVCVALALGTATNAQADESDFVIHEVNVNFTSNTLTIKGEAEDFNFEDVDLASDLEVTLGEIGNLGIVSATETEIVAALPPGIPDGDYLLTVTVFVGGDDDDDSLSGRYDLTIGTVGLQGEKGEKGDKGDKGDTGVQGLQGPAGLVGATGAAGPQGPAGSVGATGAAGPQGPVGPEGPSGSFNLPAPTWAIAPNATDRRFTHFESPSWRVYTTDPNSITVEHISGFSHLNITHPTNCAGDISDGSSTLVQKHRSANQNGQGLTGTFCSEGSMMFIQISRPIIDRNDTLWMRCWKTHSNANMCQRAF